MCSVESKPLFRDLTAEDPDPEVTQIESMCMNCHKNGMTRLLLTRIPYYKNVVLMSFSCEECGYANNEIQPGGVTAELGVKWKLNVETAVDMNRQVVKSDYTAVRIPELDFEIPAQSQKGEVTTVEGIIARAVQGLLQDQEARKQDHPEAAEQIELFTQRLQSLKELQQTWTLELDDISGNCFIQNPEMPRKDPRCQRQDYTRTKQQNHDLGIFTCEEVSDEPPSSLLAPVDPENCTLEQMTGEEVVQFPTNCPECNAPAVTNMKLTHIPHFKEVVIMATICDDCGHRTNEVKSGGGIEEKGVKFEVRIAGRDDFSRDILKSETCTMSIPELDLEVGGKALGGRFTTAEGLLQSTRDQLADSPGINFDAPSDNKPAVDRFLKQLDEALEGKRAVTVILDDPAGNSYVQSFNDDDPTLPDDGLKITRYVRSYEQNDDLGLNDMKTEGYECNGSHNSVKPEAD